MKIKVSFGNDLRLFKYDGASLLEAFEGLNMFIGDTFGVSEYRLQYRDEEDDLVTLSSENELDEALDVASEQGKTLKVFVVAAVARQDAKQVEVEEPQGQEQEQEATELKADVPPPREEVEENDETENGNENEDDVGASNMHDLAKLLMEEEGFRQEFAAFAQDVVLQLREGDEFETAVRTALVSHEELASHPFMGGEFLNMLPFMAVKAQFLVPMMKNIEPTQVPGMIERAVSAMKEGEHMMPLFMNMCGSNNKNGGGVGVPFGGFGGMPFFGGGCGPHQGMNGAAGHAHAEQGAHGHPPHGHHAWFGHHARGRGHGFGRGRGHGRRGRGRGKFHGGHGRCGKKSGEFRVDIVDSDVTVADRAVVLPRTSVVKTWRIRNVGEEAFPEGTKLKYVGRPFNQLVDGVEFPVEPIAPGEEGEVSILLSTPEEGGRYGSAWRLQLPDGSPFGPMFRARVVVAGEENSSDSSDDMADVYDTVPRRELKKEKKARKLDKMMAKRERLEAQLAKLTAKIEATEEALSGLSSAAEDVGDEEQDEVEFRQRPIVSTLVTAGGDDLEDDGDDGSATVVVNETETDVFANELAELESMGFTDIDLNRMLLRQHNGELQPVLNTLCELRA